MKFLVLGDPHLGHESATFTPPDLPDPVDYVVVTGDILDRRAEDITPARQFIKELSTQAAVVMFVSGNHDFQFHDEVTAEADAVTSLKSRSMTVKNRCFYGVGATEFDAGPEVRYPSYLPDHAVSGTETELATAIHQLHTGTTTVDEIPFDVTDTTAFQQDLDRYANRYENLCSLEAGCGGEPSVLVTHVPPFNTPLDRITESHPRLGGLHWGSLALRNYLQRTDIPFVVSGHVHEGEGTTSIAGTTCLNAGFRSAYQVTVEDTVSVDPVRWQTA